MWKCTKISVGDQSQMICSITGHECHLKNPTFFFSSEHTIPQPNQIALKITLSSVEDLAIYNISKKSENKVRGKTKCLSSY